MVINCPRSVYSITYWEGAHEVPLLPEKQLVGGKERRAIFLSGITTGKLSLIKSMTPTHALARFLVKYCRSRTCKKSWN